jgi:hypothetical protein
VSLWRLVAASPGCGGGRSGTDHKVGSGRVLLTQPRVRLQGEGNRDESAEVPRRRRASDCRGGRAVGAARAALMSNKDAIVDNHQRRRASEAGKYR